MRCSRDKTRCDFKSPKCSRCNEKGVGCQYNTAAPRKAPNLQETDAARRRYQSKEIAFLAWPKCSDLLTAAFLALPSEASVSPEQIDGDADANLVPLGDWQLDADLFEKNDFDLVLSDHQSSSLGIGISPPPMTFLNLPGMRLFGVRASVTPTQQPIASIILRLLRSYPSMLLRKETFPPFISPLLYTWAKQGGGRPLESLINCVNLVQMFKMQTATDRRFVWGLIRVEQERLWSEVRTSHSISTSTCTLADLAARKIRQMGALGSAAIPSCLLSTAGSRWRIATQ